MEMISKSIVTAIVAVFLLVSSAAAQRTEVTISLNEQFFDTLLDAIFQNSPPPEFPLSTIQTDTFGRNTLVSAFSEGSHETCGDSIKLLRENSAARTAVRFRDGKIYSPVAFSGTYNPPLIGCIDFAGYAETNIELQFDRASQRLTGNVKVINVNFNGTSGVGGALIARMIQSSIDKKLNPIEIISLDKLSFPVTLQNSARIKMRATGLRHEITGGALNVIISYEFIKA